MIGLIRCADQNRESCHRICKHSKLVQQWQLMAINSPAVFSNLAFFKIYSGYGVLGLFMPASLTEKLKGGGEVALTYSTYPTQVYPSYSAIISDRVGRLSCRGCFWWGNTIDVPKYDTAWLHQSDYLTMI